MQTVYRRMVVVVDWSIQTLYRGVVVVVDCSMQTVYRRIAVVMIAVVEWSGVCRLFTEEW